ncbi:hypothetical protein LPJ64_005529 [Coemansia asiatica]|uniref:VPS37 C-terminal domain-containing protein n=1 Tax=Coemansia asiatica TaxID=1052880 RepID=A0A9W7XH32_9FUNG|nr:hypothetical protein LPJ64_005529 [Coemansia asiatica]
MSENNDRPTSSDSTKNDISTLREFEVLSGSPQGPLSLPQYVAKIPEPMNNYNLPADRREIEEKLLHLREQFPTFANKSADDLEDLLRYEDLFQAHIDGLEQIQVMRTLEYELREENERLAQVNLSSEEELKRMRENVAELQMFASSLTTRLYELVQQHLDLQKPYSPLVLLRRLRDEGREFDEQSEKLVSEFMDKDVVESADCEEFVKSYKTQRTKFHSSEMRCKLADAAYKSGTLAGVPMTMDR